MEAVEGERMLVGMLVGMLDSHMVGILDSHTLMGMLVGILDSHTFVGMLDSKMVGMLDARAGHLHLRQRTGCMSEGGKRTGLIMKVQEERLSKKDLWHLYNWRYICSVCE